MNKRLVPGDGNTTSNIMLVGEAPAHNEVREGKPFVGKSGKELSWYCLPTAGLRRDQLYIDNVYQYQIPADGTAKKKHIAETFEEQRMDFLKRLNEVNPEIVICAGAIATNVFLDKSMELVHGIPHRVEMPEFKGIVIPTYHPAAGIHNTSQMTLIRKDWEAVGKYLRSEIGVWNGDKRDPEYYCINSKNNMILSALSLRDNKILAIDTETVGDNVWSIQYSKLKSDRNGFMLLSSDTLNIHIFGEIINKYQPLIVLHNASFDLIQLAKLGIYPKQFIDTMNMAYLLGDEPQGLKTLAYRNHGIVMQSYSEMIAEATQVKARKYVEEVLVSTWPDPEPIKEWSPKKNDWHIRKPQNIAKKVTRALSDLDKGKDIDLRERWLKMDGRAIVEQSLGPLEPGYLSDIELDKAVEYGCRDADVTLLTAYHLAQRIAEQGIINKDIELILEYC